MYYRSVGLTVGLLCVIFLSKSWAQDPVTDYPVDSRIRLTGILQIGKQPQTSAYPLLSVWLGEQNGQFQVTRVEPLIPEYPAEDQLRQVSGLGLRLVAEKEALATLQDPSNSHFGISYFSMSYAKARGLTKDGDL